MIHPLDFVIAQEGGFVNDPKDPGGATKYGISLRFLKTVDPALADLDQDGDIDMDDVWAMSEPQARVFYMKYFYEPLNIDQYGPALGAVILDTAVNMGRSRSLRLLQQALTVCGHPVPVDGVAGPVTRAAVARINKRGLIVSYLLCRVFVYADLCQANKELRRFFFGWINRVQALARFADQLAKGAK